MIVGPHSGVIVSYPGGPAEVECISFSIETVDTDFIVNGSFLDSITLKNVIVENIVNSLGQSRGGIIRFADLPVEYNNTSIQCRAELSMGLHETAPRPAVLLLQG